MNRKVGLKLFIASILVAFSLSLTIGAKVLATTEAPKAEPKVKMHDKFEKKHVIIEGFTDDQMKIVKASMVESMTNTLKSLVSKGTITQEQSDKILAHDRDVFQNLNAEQKGALKSALQAARKDTLDKLVKSGKITQEQADQLSNVRGPQKKD